MFVYYVNIPLNLAGIEEFESYAEEMPNVYTVELTEAEYKILRKPKGLFSLFDQSLGTIIDVCEEERIEKEQLDQAIKLTEELMKKTKDDLEIRAIEKIMQSLEVAYQAQTFWEIDIYLE